MESKMDKKGFCPEKDKYERIYSEACDCLYCQNKEACSYWTARENDKEVKCDNYQCYLLRRDK